MMKRFLQILALLAAVLFVAGGLYLVSNKWEQVEAEAKSRCADPAVRKDRTVERCVSYLMSYYHIYSRLPDVGFGAIVSAQVPQASTVRPSTLTEVVANNIYLFRPGDDGETSDDVQLDLVLRNFGDKYRITGLVITERKRNIGHGVVIMGIAQARIIVEPK
ncbi:MAG: hypothetical protein WAX80_02935 [Minisyncoccia bacterium]